MFDLLPSQRASLYDAIRSQGRDPAEFKWLPLLDPDEGREMMNLVHTPSGFWFRFIDSSSSNGHEIKFSPGVEKAWNAGTASNWTTLLVVFKKWLQFLAREVSTSDPWTVVTPPAPIPIGPGGTDDNSGFTGEELRVINSQLDSLAAEIERLQLGTNEERRAVSAVLDQVKASAARLGRKDWRAAFLGSLMGLLLDRLVTASTMQSLWHLAQTVFKGAAHLLGAG